VALEDGAGDADYLPLLARHLEDVLERHRPDFVFYLAGADPFEGDRLGRLRMTIDGLRARDELVLGRCRALGLPVAISMSGGYAHDIDTIVTIHANTIAVAAGFWSMRETDVTTFPAVERGTGQGAAAHGRFDSGDGRRARPLLGG
jgi:acetoin utilization deacetylase AcuC-like enzyme